jgi:hypothetical protein
MKKTITFKSIPTNWIKEKSGKKKNTVRFFDDGLDPRKIVLDLFIKGMVGKLIIKLKNTKTKETFERTASDVTELEVGLNTIYIISWS